MNCKHGLPNMEIGNRHKKFVMTTRDSFRAMATSSLLCFFTDDIFALWISLSMTTKSNTNLLILNNDTYNFDSYNYDIYNYDIYKYAIYNYDTYN